MNQPIEQRFNKLEQRLEKLEEDRNGIVESEQLLLKLARLHRISLQELKAQIELDMGDIRERLDTVERKIDKIEVTQETHGEILEQILNLIQKREE